MLSWWCSNHLTYRRILCIYLELDHVGLGMSDPLKHPLIGSSHQVYQMSHLAQNLLDLHYRSTRHQLLQSTFFVCFLFFPFSLIMIMMGTMLMMPVLAFPAVRLRLLWPQLAQEGWDASRKEPDGRWSDWKYSNLEAKNITWYRARIFVPKTVCLAS